MRKMRSLAIPVVVVLVAVAIGACGSSNSSSSSSSGSSSAASSGSSGGSSSSGGGTVNGSGSTFAAPIYEQWSSNVKSQGLTVNYAATGSGTGVAQLQAGTVDFAGSDPAMKDSEIKAAKGPVFHFPIAFGAITISYNLSGVKSGLKLDGKTIADIFLGKVKTWNDPEIASLNPGMKPAEPADHGRAPLRLVGHDRRVHPVLSDYSPEWKAQVGPARKSSSRPVRAGRATPAWRRRSSRPPARSATSSRHTRFRTDSPSRRSRTRPATMSCRRWRRPRPLATGIKVPA